jgi:hypothetical protein
MPLEMAHKVILPQKKIMSRSFLNSGTLKVNNSLLQTVAGHWPGTKDMQPGLVCFVFKIIHVNQKIVNEDFGHDLPILILWI